MDLLNQAHVEIQRVQLVYIGVVECHLRMLTLLHAVCHCYQQDNNTIELLLNAGACPIATDKYVLLFFSFSPLPDLLMEPLSNFCWMPELISIKQTMKG